MLRRIFDLLGWIACGAPVIAEYLDSRYITHVPLAILATGMMMISVTFLNCALTLDTMVSHERQRNELAVLNSGGN